MKRLIAAICFTLAATPFAFAQDKAKDTEKKAPAAAEKSAKTDAPKGQADEKKSAMAVDKSAVEPPKAKGDGIKKEPSEKQKAQQARMKECSGKAGDLKKEERNKFMSACLKGQDDKKADKAPKGTAQQTKMGDCNKEAKEKDLKKDERKKFMKECLSK